MLPGAEEDEAGDRGDSETRQPRASGQCWLQSQLQEGLKRKIRGKGGIIRLASFLGGLGWKGR